MYWDNCIVNESRDCSDPIRIPVFRPNCSAHDCIINVLIPPLTIACGSCMGPCSSDWCRIHCMCGWFLNFLASAHITWLFKPQGYSWPAWGVNSVPVSLHWVSCCSQGLTEVFWTNIWQRWLRRRKQFRRESLSEQEAVGVGELISRAKRLRRIAFLALYLWSWTTFS